VQMNTKKKSTIAICLTAILAFSPVVSLRRLLSHSAVKLWLCGQARWGSRSSSQILDRSRPVAGI